MPTVNCPNLGCRFHQHTYSVKHEVVGGVCGRSEITLISLPTDQKLFCKDIEI